MGPTGLLYRVGVDSVAGGWNAPCRDDGAFCYVPIPEPRPDDRRDPFAHTYNEVRPFAAALGASWPTGLSGICHLDPDFAHLTYGDWRARGRRLLEFLEPGSFLVFWAALRWLDGERQGSLVCSIIGFYRVARVVRAAEVGPLDAHRNAHTRRATTSDDEVVVFADPVESGRLRRHIPIGRHRDGAQRVDKELLAAWGGLRRKAGESLRDGYIQMSGSPPFFREPGRFLEWFRRQGPELVHANNLIDPPVE